MSFGKIGRQTEEGCRYFILNEEKDQGKTYPNYRQLQAESGHRANGGYVTLEDLLFFAVDIQRKKNSHIRYRARAIDPFELSKLLLNIEKNLRQSLQERGENAINSILCGFIKQEILMFLDSEGDEYKQFLESGEISERQKKAILLLPAFVLHKIKRNPEQLEVVRGFTGLADTFRDQSEKENIDKCLVQAIENAYKIFFKVLEGGFYSEQTQAQDDWQIFGRALQAALPQWVDATWFDQITRRCRQKFSNWHLPDTVAV